MEPYLPECLESICGQLAADTACEVILIDDGSTDRSAVIAQEYGKKYPQFRLISQENQGPSEARNAGLRQSRGQYVMFIDSDDYIAADLLVHLKQQLTEKPCDVLFLEGFKVYASGRTERLDRSCQMDLDGRSKSEILQEIADCDRFPASPCTKVWRRELLLQYDLWFEKGKICEDIAWSVRLYLCAKSFGKLSGPAYYYRQERSGSTTTTVTPKRVADLEMAIRQGRAAVADAPEHQRAVYGMMAYETEVLLLLYGQLKRSERRQFRKGLSDLCGQLKFRNKSRTKLLRLLLALIGVDKTAGLLSLAYRCRGRWKRR